MQLWGSKTVKRSDALLGKRNCPRVAIPYCWRVFEFLFDKRKDNCNSDDCWGVLLQRVFLEYKINPDPN